MGTRCPLLDDHWLDRHIFSFISTPPSAPSPLWQGGDLRLRNRARISISKQINDPLSAILLERTKEMNIHGFIRTSIEHECSEQRSFAKQWIISPPSSTGIPSLSKVRPTESVRILTHVSDCQTKNKGSQNEMSSNRRKRISDRWEQETWRKCVTNQNWLFDPAGVSRLVEQYLPPDG